MSQDILVCGIPAEANRVWFWNQLRSGLRLAFKNLYPAAASDIYRTMGSAMNDCHHRWPDVSPKTLARYTTVVPFFQYEDSTRTPWSIHFRVHYWGYSYKMGMGWQHLPAPLCKDQVFFGEVKTRQCMFYGTKTARSWRSGAANRCLKKIVEPSRWQDVGPSVV
jgi:hypothetical protein